MLVLEREMGGRHQKIYRFKNGYGASVVKLPKDVAGGTWDLWELAVIRFYGDKPTSYRIVYDTPITNDVVSYLLWADVEEYLEQIKALEAKEQ